MNKEEKKAIHLLQSYSGMTHKLTDNQGRPKLDQAIEKVLNLIEKQQKEIEDLENENKEIIDYTYKNDSLLDLYNKEKEKNKNINYLIKTTFELKENMVSKTLKEHIFKTIQKDYISKDKIKEEIKKLSENNGIAVDMHTGQIVKTEEDYKIAILRKLLRSKK